MGSLPKSKAGVGSAMNDTTRQIGGALGVAVIGSLFASAYRPGVGAALAGTGATPGFIAAAKDSLGSALNAAGALPGPLADRVTLIARQDFVDAMGGALLLGAGALLVAAAIVFAFLPARARVTIPEGIDAAAEDEEVHAVDGPALEGLASLTFAEAEGMLELDASTASAHVPQAERRTG